MLNLKQGVDILGEAGGINSIDDARSLLKGKLDSEHLARLDKIKTDDAIIKIANAVVFCQPDSVYISTGSKEDMLKVIQMSLDKGEEKTLAMKDHTIHYDLAEEQGRIVDRTYYIINEGDKVSVLGKLSDGSIVAVKENNLLATSFHPELTDDARMHGLFVDMVREYS